MKKPEFFDYDKYLSAKPLKNKSDENASDTQTAQNEADALNDKKNRNAKSNKKKSEKIDAVESIKNAFGNALDEDVTEIAEFSVTKSIEEETPIAKKPSFKRSLYFVIGIVVSFMSLIGFISSVVFCANIVTSIADNTKQKNEFSKIIYPVVIVDPAAFEKPSQLSSDTVITAAIWDIILYGDTSKYPQEFGTMTIPQLDVELHATNLFGSGLTFEHKTLGDAALSFYYTEETQSYNVPVSPKFFPYSPQIENIKRDGDTYTLKVGYISPSPAWLMKEKDTKIEPDKYMEYVLTKVNNDYTLSAINEIEGDKNSSNAF